MRRTTQALTAIFTFVSLSACLDGDGTVGESARAVTEGETIYVPPQPPPVVVQRWRRPRPPRPRPPRRLPRPRGWKKPKIVRPRPYRPRKVPKPRPRKVIGKRGTVSTRFTTTQVAVLVTDAGLGLAVPAEPILVDATVELVDLLRSVVHVLGDGEAPVASAVPAACASTAAGAECVVDLPVECDPARVTGGQTCAGPVETCAEDADGCDPSVEPCCGDDMVIMCAADDSGAPCAADDPCCVEESVPACDLDAALVAADDPSACDGPGVMLPACEPADGGECIELADGTALGGGTCCGEPIEEIDLCSCVIDYCDPDDPSLCAAVDVPASDHVCADTTFCDAFADPFVPADECECVRQSCTEEACTEELIAGSTHDCADASFCDAYAAP